MIVREELLQALSRCGNRRGAVMFLHVFYMYRVYIYSLRNGKMKHDGLMGIR